MASKNVAKRRVLFGGTYFVSEKRARAIEAESSNLHPEPETNFNGTPRQVSQRDLSSKIGPYHAQCVRQERADRSDGWATVALMEIRQQSVQPGT